jgi:hypothetical protein
MWMKQWKEPKVKIQFAILEKYIYQKCTKNVGKEIYMQSYKIIFLFFKSKFWCNYVYL